MLSTPFKQAKSIALVGLKPIDHDVTNREETHQDTHVPLRIEDTTQTLMSELAHFRTRTYAATYRADSSMYLKSDLVVPR